MRTAWSGGDVDRAASDMYAKMAFKARQGRIRDANVRKSTVAAGDRFRHRNSGGVVTILQIRGLQAQIERANGKRDWLQIIAKPGIGAEIPNYIKVEDEPDATP